MPDECKGAGTNPEVAESTGTKKEEGQAMMDTDAEIKLAIAIVCVVIFYRVARWCRGTVTEDEEEEKPLDGIDALQLSKEVEALGKKMRRLEQLDEMVIDLRLCKPAEVQRAFRMEWISAAGKNHEFEFMADGENASTEYLLELATAEREELNAEILQRVYDLYMRACELDFRGSEESE